jgi:hypothetical protein
MSLRFAEAAFFTFRYEANLPGVDVGLAAICRSGMTSR